MIYFIMIIFGTLFICLFMSNIAKIYKLSILGYIGTNSLLYYVLHQTICRILNNIVFNNSAIISIGNNAIGAYILTLALDIFIVALLVIPIEIINRKLNFLKGKF